MGYERDNIYYYRDYDNTMASKRYIQNAKMDCNNSSYSNGIQIFSAIIIDLTVFGQKGKICLQNWK